MKAILSVFVGWVVVIGLTPSVLGLDPIEIAEGPYRAAVGPAGMVVYHDGTRLSLGSYFTVYKPEYKGTHISYGDFWKNAVVEKRTDGIEATAKLPGGQARYRIGVGADGVVVEVGIKAAEGIEIGPREYAAFQIPADLVAGGTVEVFNNAGTVIESKPVPATPKRGGMARSGNAFCIKTPERTIEISTEGGTTVYPFDARVTQYGARQGIWAFSSLPVSLGYETTVVRRLRVLPPPKPRHQGTVVFSDGTDVSRIVIEPTSTERERFAAAELADYIEKICGKKIKIEEVGSGMAQAGDLVVGKRAVSAGLVTRADLASLELDGYVVRVTADQGAVCGWRDLGTIYGAYALLRQLGVKFYAPGCEVVPEISALTIPVCELRAKPLLEFRKMTQSLKLGHTPADDLGNPREIGEPGGLVHAAAYLVPFDMYHDEHPEYFALQPDGKRLHRDPHSQRFDVHLCLSNPDVQRISAERLIALMDKQPDRTFFGVSQGDGHAWCRCEKCEALDTVPGKVMTDRLLTYVNAIAREVAKKYPEKRILTLAYTQATSPPPIRVKPEPNVMVQFCPYPGRVYCQSHFFTCEKNVGGYEDIQGWFKLAPDNMYIFDYPRGYKIWYEPFGSFYAMKQKMEYYLENGVKGIYYCGVPTNFRDLFIYVQSAMHWNRHVDVEAFIDEFMAVYYGEAAPFIREYFDIMHREVVERQVHQMCEGRCPGIITPELAEKARSLFAQAESAVADRPAQLYRVRDEEFCVVFADLNERNPVNGKLVVSEGEFARRLAEFMALGRFLSRRTIGRREDGIVSDWLFKICRLRTRTEPWFADPLCRRMIASPESTFNAERTLYCQTAIDGGVRIELEAFVGCHGPKEYSYQCEPRRAVWIYGTNTQTPDMRADFELAKVPDRGAKLVITGQDDDKPGTVEVEISINGKTLFSGPNGCLQNGWSSNEFAVAPDVCRVGKNTLRIRTLKQSPQKDAGWFMLSECKLMLGNGRD